MRALKTQTETRKQQILKAALELIGAHGVYGLSIQAIAERVGIVPSALYRHFRSKDDVLDAILELIQKRLLANVSLVRKETTDPLRRLESLAMRHARMLSENPAIPYIVLSDGIYAGHPDRKTRIAAIIRRYLNELEDIIEEGRGQGAIRAEVVPATAAVMFLGLLLPAAVLGSTFEDGFDMIGHVGNAWPAFMRGIAADNGVGKAGVPGPAVL